MLGLSVPGQTVLLLNKYFFFCFIDAISHVSDPVNKIVLIAKKIKFKILGFALVVNQ
jgi:hypothetical protein